MKRLAFTHYKVHDLVADYYIVPFEDICERCKKKKLKKIEAELLEYGWKKKLHGWAEVEDE